MLGDLNLAFGVSATVTSTRRNLAPANHSSLTLSIVATQAGTWLPYAIDETSGARLPLLGAARSLVAGTGDSITVIGTFSRVEIDYANTNATAGTYSWSYAVGG